MMKHQTFIHLVADGQNPSTVGQGSHTQRSLQPKRPLLHLTRATLSPWSPTTQSTEHHHIEHHHSPQQSTELKLADTGRCRLSPITCPVL